MCYCPAEGGEQSASEFAESSTAHLLGGVALQQLHGYDVRAQ